VKVDNNVIYSNDHVDSNYWSKDFTYFFPHASPHSVTVTASDEFNNTAAQTEPVEVHVIDKNAPVVELNAEYNADVREIYWSARAEDPNLYELNVYIGNDLVRSCIASSSSVSCSGNYEVNAPGNYDVVARSVDRYGNESERQVSVSVVDEAPVIHVSNMVAPVGKEVNVPVAVSDDFGLAAVEVSGYGIHYESNVAGRTFAHSFAVTYPEDGNYTYFVRAWDVSGNVSEANFVVVASRAGHSYELVLSKQNGAPAKVWAEGKVDGSFVDLSCSDAVIHVVRTDDRTAIAQYDVKTVQRNGHAACEVDISGAGYYQVAVSWQGVQKSIGVHAFQGVSSAPENPVVAVGVALVLLAIAARFI